MRLIHPSPQPVSLLDLLRLGQRHQLASVGGGLVQSVPPTTEVSAPAEASTTAVHGPGGLGGVHELEAGLVLLVVVGVLGAARPVLALVLGHISAVLVSVTGPVRHLPQTIGLGERLVGLK